MKKALILVFVFVGFTLHLKAEGNFGLHVGASFPTGDFANDNSDNGGGAGTGLNVGIKYFHPLSSYKGLSLTLGVDYLNNGLDQSTKDILKQQTNTAGISDVVIDYTNYINIPVLAGLNFKQPVDHTLAIFADAAIGVNYSNMTDLVITYKYEGTAIRSTLSFTPLTRLAYQFGGGLLINNNYTIGLHYNLLGSYSFKAKATQESSGYSQTSDVTTNADIKINMLTLSLGIRF